MGNGPSGSNRDSERDDLRGFFSSNNFASVSESGSPSGTGDVDVMKKKVTLSNRFKRYKNNKKREIEEKRIISQRQPLSQLEELEEAKKIAPLAPKDFKPWKHRDKITKILVTEDYVWSCSVDKNICCWDKQTGECKRVLQGHRKAVTCLAFDTNNNNMLYSGSYDRTVRSWNIETGECCGIYNQNDNWITAIAVSEPYLYCGGYDCIVNVYDVKTRRKVQILEGHVKRIEDIILDENEKVYTSSADQTVRVWDVDSGECLNVFHSRDHCFELRIYDNILCCKNYEQVQCWDIETNKQLSPFLGISTFDISNHVLVGFCSSQRRFEFYSIENDDRTLLATIPETNILNTTSIVYNKKLYYAVGKGIQVAEVDFGQKKETPKYVHHRDLFNYYVDILLYPPNAIAECIDTLHNKGAFTECKTLDQEIDILGGYINCRGAVASIATPVGEDKRVRFSIDLRIDEASSSNQIYTRDELSLDFETRTELFYERLRSNLEPQDVQQPTVILVRRNELVFDACKHFSVLRDEDLHKPMYIFFQGEKGLDMGGVTREFYQLLSEQILDSNNALFLPTSTNQTYHPNPASAVNESHLQYFRFIGKLVGKAIFDLQMMDTHFSRVIFKLIVGKSITYADLEHVDPALFLSLERIVSMNNVEMLDLSFTAEVNDFGRGNFIELVHKGNQILVTDENKFEFVERYARWKLVDSVRMQLERFLHGVYEVIPRAYFTIFDEQELELLLCGSPEIDVDEWRANTEYEGGFTPDNEIIINFWNMVEEMGQVQRSKLLQFVTGTTCVPLDGFEGLHPRFTICYVRSPDDFLPVAHTCLNRLDIPKYADKHTLEQRFIQAIDHGLLGFDRI